MEMHQVRYFLAVAEHLNFTRAADIMHVAQPSLTRAIQKLEEELGGPLFRRERGNTHLTELGRLMRPHLAATLAAAEAAKRQAMGFRKREAGQLILGTCRTICAEMVLPYLSDLAVEIAGLDIQVDTRTADDIIKALMTGTVDAAVICAVGPLPDVRLDEAVIQRDAFAVAFSDHHPFTARRAITLEDLDGAALAIRTDCWQEDAVAEAMEARGITRTVRHRSTDEGWLADLVRNGFGCRVMPESMAAYWRLPYRVLADLPLEARIVLITVAGRRHSPALAGLLRLVRTRPRPDAMIVGTVPAALSRKGGERTEDGLRLEPAGEVGVDMGELHQSVAADDIGRGYRQQP